jgi:hypothetical protein
MPYHKALAALVLQPGPVTRSGSVTGSDRMLQGLWAGSAVAVPRRNERLVLVGAERAFMGVVGVQYTTVKEVTRASTASSHVSLR